MLFGKKYPTPAPKIGLQEIKQQEQLAKAKEADQAFISQGGVIEFSNSQKLYKTNGVLHRVDGPAVVDDNGSYKWFQHGLPHREGGPAIEDIWGLQRWMMFGLRHRSDGPAYSVNHTRMFFIFDEYVRHHQFLHWQQTGTPHEDLTKEFYEEDLLSRAKHPDRVIRLLSQ